MFYLSDLPEVYNSSDESVKEADNGLRLTEGTKIFFFLVIITSNMIFFIYWIYKMIDEAANTLRNKFEKLYLYLCLCGNRRKLEIQKRQREIKDYNDILKEEFDRSLDSIRELHSGGKLILNGQNIEKITTYFNTDRFLKAIAVRKELSEDEIKQMKRNKRIAMTSKIGLFKKNLIFPISELEESKDCYKHTQNLEMNINDDIAGFSDFDQKSNPPTFRKPNLGSPHDVSFVTSLDDSKTNIKMGREVTDEAMLSPTDNKNPQKEEGFNIMDAYDKIYQQCQDLDQPEKNSSKILPLPMQSEGIQGYSERDSGVSSEVPIQIMKNSPTKRKRDRLKPSKTVKKEKQQSLKDLLKNTSLDRSQRRKPTKRNLEPPPNILQSIDEVPLPKYDNLLKEDED